ncbi:hypothetical protein K180097E11_18490 [Phocaeicola dorei]|jgi:hypothetical protein
MPSAAEGRNGNPDSGSKQTNDLIVTNKANNYGSKKQHTYQALQHIIERGSQPKNSRIYA